MQSRKWFVYQVKQYYSYCWSFRVVEPAITEQEAEEYPGKGKIDILADVVLQLLFTMAVISHEQLKIQSIQYVDYSIYCNLIYFELIYSQNLTCTINN